MGSAASSIVRVCTDLPSAAETVSRSRATGFSSSNARAARAPLPITAASLHGGRSERRNRQPHRASDHGGWSQRVAAADSHRKEPGHVERGSFGRPGVCHVARDVIFRARCAAQRTGMRAGGRARERHERGREDRSPEGADRPRRRGPQGGGRLPHAVLRPGRVARAPRRGGPLPWTRTRAARAELGTLLHNAAKFTSPEGARASRCGARRRRRHRARAAPSRIRGIHAGRHRDAIEDVLANARGAPSGGRDGATSRRAHAVA